ncbi:MAG TPA: MFS transporter [Pilimelia sp.]|nr:MFS transporter [Pilimelia sp.]
MTAMTAESARRRFLVLTVFRWLPPGLLFTVLIPLALDRGLSLSELGLAAAMQGIVVFVLELPTGGLADSVGRRRMLLLSMVISIAATGLMLMADSFATFAVVFALLGIYRALDSGPLEAWYVDAALAADPDAPIDRGMSGHGTALGLSIAAGALASGGLVALDPLPSVDALLVPVALALVVQVAGLVVAALLMAEAPRSVGLRGVARSALATPRTIASGLGLLRRSPVLLALVAVELFWGFGMVCFEGLLPARLVEILGGTDQAAAVIGPATAAAWLASAAGAFAMPWLGRRLGIAPAAALMRLAQGAAVAGMGLFAGVTGILVAYLACYAVHGASSAAHMTLLHRQAEGPVRATVVSLNSMVSQPAGALGLVVLTAIADAASISTAMYVGAVVLAAAAPLYLPAWRQAATDSAAPRRVADVRS